MEGLKVFENSEFGKLEVLEIDGKPYFPATACARMLGYTNPQKAIRDHCKGVIKTFTPSGGGTQEVNHVPEGDLYRLIIRSNLPKAQEFERWVFDEVLPSIRKSGRFVSFELDNELNLLNQILKNVAACRVMESTHDDLCKMYRKRLNASLEERRSWKEKVDLMLRVADISMKRIEEIRARNIDETPKKEVLPDGIRKTDD